MNALRHSCIIVSIVFFFLNQPTIGQYSEFRVTTDSFQNQEEASVTSTPSGDYLVSFTTASTGCSKEIGVRWVSSKGTLLTERNPVDTYCGGDQQFSDVASLNDTRFVVVWQSSGGQDGSGYGVYRRICTINGTCQDANDALVPVTTAGNQTIPRVAQIGNSSYHVVVWYHSNSSYEAIYARIFDSVTGTASSGEILVQGSLTTGNLSNPDIDGGLAFDGYRWFVTWQLWEGLTNGWTVKAAIGFLNGTVGTIVTIPSQIVNDQKNPCAAYSFDKLIIGWDSVSGSYPDVYYRTVSSTFLFNAEVNLSSGSGLYQQHITCSWSSNGNYLLGWTGNQNSYYDIYFDVFTSWGSQIGTKTTANDYTDYDQYAPSVAGGANGQFFVVWTSLPSPLDGSGAGVLGKFFETQLHFSGVPSSKSFSWTEDTIFLFNSTGILAVFPFYNPDLVNVTLQIMNPTAATVNTPTGSGLTVTPSSVSVLAGSAAAANAVLNQIVITPSSNYDQSYVLRLRIIDVPAVTNFTVDITMVAIPVNDSPQWLNNTLVVTEGQNVSVKATDVVVADPDSTLGQIQFTVTNITNGFFFIGSTQVSSFSMGNLTNGVVNFAHDGSDFAPTYTLKASDGLNSSSSNGIVYFTPANDPPVLVNNSLAILEGQLLQITTANIGIYDDSSPNSVIITIFSVEQGNFIASGSYLNSFTQSAINSGIVYFEHNGSDVAPSYIFTVTDSEFTIGSFTAVINFTNVNDPPTIILQGVVTILQGQSVVLTSSMISVEDPDSYPSDIYIQIVQTIALAVVDSDTNQPKTNFSLGQLNNLSVTIVHDGGPDAPSLTVLATDGMDNSAAGNFNFNFVPSSPSPTPTTSPASLASSSPSTTPQTDGGGNNKKGNSTVILAAAVGGGGGLLAVACLASVLILRKKRSKKEHKTQEPEPDDVTTNYRALELQTSPGNPQPEKKIDDPFKIDYTELEIGKELGRGAFGIVYKAQWRNGDCVVKQLDIDRLDSDALKQFLKEADTLKQLRMHPNVCSLLGVCSDPKHPVCIVMEYLPGGSLLDYLAKGKLKVDHKVAVQLYRDIASGMSHIHQEGLLHCDLAARNLLVAPRGEDQVTVKIADFGLAKSTESGIYSLNSNSKFPIRWTAPEVFETGRMTKASDVWSFGVVMWEIMEQKVPYYELGNQDIAAAICNKGHRLGKPTKVECPDELYSVMAACFARNPDERPSFADLVHTFKALEKQWEDAERATCIAANVHDTAYSSMSGQAQEDDKKGPSWNETNYEQRGNSAIYHT